jgi:outer membrane protein assembly complex protein YaeT
MLRISIWTLILSCIASCIGNGQTESFEGKMILAVEYSPAIQPLDPHDLARVQLLRTGSAFRASDVAESIERMFATGRYSDIQVEAEPRQDGVAVRFITRDTRFIGRVDTSGKINNPPSAAQIMAASQLNLGAPFQPELLAQAQKSIQQLYTNNGLYEATVKLEPLDDPAHEQTDVRIVVNPGVRARYTTPVIRGDAKLSDSTIIRATGWRLLFIKRWRKVSEALTNKGIDDIGKKYQKKDRLTASVNLDSLDYDPEVIRAKPSLNIDAGPRIQIKAVNAKVSKGRLKRYVPIYEEGSVDQDLLVEGARNLRDYFQSKGYPDVDVNFRQLPPQSDEETIEYIISRGPRQKLVRISFDGLRYFDEDTIRERLFLQPSSFRMRWGRYSEAFRAKDAETIESLYRANGFRDVHVTSAIQKNVNGKAGNIATVFKIREGPQWVVAHLKLVGFTHIAEGDVLPTLNCVDGQPYSDISVGIDRATVLSLYQSRGYRHATFSVSASTAGPNRMNLAYKVEEGEQEFVRDVLISGLKSTKAAIVQRDIALSPGDPLSLSQDRASQRSLYNLGIFSNIDTAIQNSEGDDQYKYVLFDFTEAHKYNLNVGVGAEIAQLGPTTSDLSTPTGGAGFSPRFTGNLNRINLWGIGHTASFQTRLSNIEQRVALSYYIPRLRNDDKRSLTFSLLYDNSRDIRTFASHREEGSVQFAQRVSKPTVILFSFAYRRVSTSDVVIPTLLVPQLLQPVRIGIFSTNLVQDRRDSPTDPHTGMYNIIDVGLASRYFGSQRDFARVLARDATYHRIGRNVVLARQTTFGIIKPYSIPAGFTSADAVPLPERFFGGGNISHRGFAENQAGPRDIGAPAGPGAPETVPTGFPLGGNAVFINNTELRFPLIGDNIGGVIFHDAGNVYSTFSDISFRFHQKNLQDFNYMVQAVGFGIRYRTPVGPVRADFAYSINAPSFVGFKGTLQDLLACNPNVPVNQLPPQCQPVVQNVGHFQFFFSIGQTF